MLACCGYMREVNLILRISSENGMECQGLCNPYGKHIVIVHFYREQSVPNIGIYIKKPNISSPKCTDHSREFAILSLVCNQC